MDSSWSLPAGFGFNPSNEEVIKEYLWPKSMGRNIPEVDFIIPTILNLCNFNPSELSSLCRRPWSREHCYLFTKWDRYGTGRRCLRKTKTGYWKKTGRELPIYDSRTLKRIGKRSILVLYEGRDAIKTDSVMHVYESSDDVSKTVQGSPYVICRLQVDSNKNKNAKNEAAIDTQPSVDSGTVTSVHEIPGGSPVITQDYSGLEELSPWWTPHSQDSSFLDGGEPSANTVASESNSDIPQMVSGQARDDFESFDHLFEDMREPIGYLDPERSLEELPDMFDIPEAMDCFVFNNHGQPTTIDSVNLEVPAATQAVSSHVVVDDISSLSQPLYSPDPNRMIPQMVCGQARAGFKSFDSAESQHNVYEERHDPNGYVDPKLSVAELMDVFYVPETEDCVVFDNHGQPTTIDSANLEVPAATQAVSSHAVDDENFWESFESLDCFLSQPMPLEMDMACLPDGPVSSDDFSVHRHFGDFPNSS